MADEKRPPASQNKLGTGDDNRYTRRAQQSYQDQQADLNVMAFNIEASRRTGKSLDETTEIMRRLTTEGDFFDDKGRWTLDVAGYPVCHKGWKPEPIEPPAP